MSQNDADDDEETGWEGPDMVTPLADMRRNGEMNAIGWVIFLGILVIALPLLPVIVVGWVLIKLFGRTTNQPTE
jgi:hypothetical protein